MGPRTLPRLAVVTASLALLAAACRTTAAGPSPSRPTAPDPRITGTIVSDDPDGTGIMYRELPDGEPRTTAVPGEVDFLPVAVVVRGGAAALAFQEDRGTLYFVPAQGGEARTLIPRLDNPGSLSGAQDHVAVGDCTKQVLVVIPVDGGPARDAGGGCIGALSPDGRRVAYAADGVVWRAPVDGSAEPEAWFALSDVTGLAELVPPQNRAVFEMTWGGPGLAVVVGNEERVAAISATEAGRVRAIDLLGAHMVTFLRWQPGGRLLGVGTGQTGAEGFIRVYDPLKDAIRTLALHPRGFVSAAWAPDGRSVVAVSGSGFFGSGPSGQWVYLDLEGRQFGNTRGGSAVIHGWLR